MSGKKARKGRQGRERVVWVPADQIQNVRDGSYDVVKESIAIRMQLNLEKTGHPFHHQTGDGTIIDEDLTLAEWMTHVSPDEMPVAPAPRADALPTVPIIRDWYRREPGKSWLKAWMESQKDGQP